MTLPRNKTASRARQKYPGKLGKAIGLRERLGLALLSQKSPKEFEDWESENLRILLDYYKIPRPQGLLIASATTWRDLALALARDHVPAFRLSGPLPGGRPKGRKSQKPRRPRGHPPDIQARLFRKQLLEAVTLLQSQQGLVGRGKGKKALEALVNMGPRTRLLSSASKKSLVEELEGDLSRAKKENPEMATKMRE